MYSSFQLAIKFLRYYISASNGRGHGMHSPFVFDFIQNVLLDKKDMHPPEAIETLRTGLKKNQNCIVVQDLGAGSRVHSKKVRSIGQIARGSLKSRKYSELLYRLVRHYHPKTIVELGTSLGVTTASLAAADSSATIYTIEGSRAVHEQATKNFRTLDLQNIRALQGNFDDVLPQLVPSLPLVDLAFIDGNHRYGPTVQYFQLLLQKCGTGSILVFDDIHWSSEMELAWQQIQQHPQVRCTVDLFFLGLVFLDPSFKTKQHFVVRY